MMQISPYTPNLTSEEVQRFWLQPSEVCSLSAVGRITDPKIKKLLNTLSDREHIPFVKSGTAKTSPRLYSLFSAAMLRVIFDITRDGRPYAYAVPIAREVASAILKYLAEVDDLNDFDFQYSEMRLVFAGVKANGEPATIKWHSKDVKGGIYMSYGVYDAGYLIYRILGNYADPWQRDLAKRGLIDPEAPTQIGADGWRVDDEGAT